MESDAKIASSAPASAASRQPYFGAVIDGMKNVVIVAFGTGIGVIIRATQSWSVPQSGSRFSRGIIRAVGTQDSGPIATDFAPFFFSNHSGANLLSILATFLRKNTHFLTKKSLCLLTGIAASVRLRNLRVLRG